MRVYNRLAASNLSPFETSSSLSGLERQATRNRPSPSPPVLSCSLISLSLQSTIVIRSLLTCTLLSLSISPVVPAAMGFVFRPGSMILRSRWRPPLPTPQSSASIVQLEIAVRSLRIIHGCAWSSLDPRPSPLYIPPKISFSRTPSE